MAGPKPEQEKSAVKATEAFGTLFEKYFPIFYRTHEGQFEDFLKANKLTDEKLRGLGVKRDDLARQWCAAQMNYYVLRYAGTVGIHYIPAKKDQRLEVRPISGPPIKTSELVEGRLGSVMRDLASGRRYINRESLAAFSSFGDCDEIGYGIAQGITATSIGANLGLTATIYPSNNHALVEVEFPKIGKFLIDPTLIVLPEEDRFPQRRISVVSMPEEEPRQPKEWLVYEKIIVPKYINPRIIPQTRALSMRKSELGNLEDAIRFASEQPHQVLALARQVNRRLWNEDLRNSEMDDVLYRGECNDLKSYFRKIRPNSTEIDLGWIYLSTFFEDPKAALDFFRNLGKQLSPDDSLFLMKKIIIPEIVQKADLDTVRQKLTEFVAKAREPDKRIKI